MATQYSSWKQELTTVNFRPTDHTVPLLSPVLPPYSSQQSCEVEIITFTDKETEAQKVRGLGHEFSTGSARIHCLDLFSGTPAISFVLHESSDPTHTCWTRAAITTVLFPFGFTPVVAWEGSGLRHVEITTAQGAGGSIGWGFLRLGWGCGKGNELKRRKKLMRGLYVP